MALSPKTARTLNTKKCKNELCSSRTELNGMFACIRRWQIVTANEKFSFLLLLECVGVAADVTGIGRLLISYIVCVPKIIESWLAVDKVIE